MDRRRFVEGTLAGTAGLAFTGARPMAATNDRAFWLESATRIARPVVASLARGELKRRLPMQTGREDRQVYAPLEAFGRTLTGLAPWLELEADASAEGQLRAEWVGLVRRGLALAVDPSSPDFMNFKEGGQPLVDAAFLALGLLRAPTSLLRGMGRETRAHLVAALRDTRRIKPGYNNWLLFSAMVEALFLEMGEDWDAMRVDLALRTLAGWYMGDGFFKDGPEYHHDYYNSFVIQPFMRTILETLRRHEVKGYEVIQALLEQTTIRYAEVLERSISPEGAFPLYGRSIGYRFGAFHLLAQVALERRLPETLAPGAVRSALGAVIRRSLEAPGTFDDEGFLRPGFAGHQPGLMERYICRGSLYLCCAVFLPLGLAPVDPFWSSAPDDWTARRAWAGADLPPDHAMEAIPRG
jgi:hypothetical protein